MTEPEDREQEINWLEKEIDATCDKLSNLRVRLSLVKGLESQLTIRRGIDLYESKLCRLQDYRRELN